MKNRQRSNVSLLYEIINVCDIMGIQTNNNLYNFDTIENCLDYIENEIDLDIVVSDEETLKEQFKLARRIIQGHYKKQMLDWIKNCEEVEGTTDKEIILKLYSVIEDHNEDYYIRQLFTEEEILKLYKESH